MLCHSYQSSDWFIVFFWNKIQKCLNLGKRFLNLSNRHLSLLLKMCILPLEIYKIPEFSWYHWDIDLSTLLSYSLSLFLSYSFPLSFSLLFYKQNLYIVYRVWFLSYRRKFIKIIKCIVCFQFFLYWLFNFNFWLTCS